MSDDQQYPYVKLTPFEQAIRDKFVDEYLIDESYENAAARIGYSGSMVAQFAYKFQTDPYVQRRITEVRKNVVNPEDEGRTPRQLRIINGLLAEAFNFGPGSSHSARVSALSKLSTIERMDAPTKIETTVEHSGAVTNTFDYSKLTSEQLKIIRQLLDAGKSKSD